MTFLSQQVALADSEPVGLWFAQHAVVRDRPVPGYEGLLCQFQRCQDICGMPGR